MQNLKYVESGEMLADLAMIRQAGTGEFSQHDDAELRDEVTQAIQQVLEFLFSGDGYKYKVPSGFWKGTLGMMIAAARLWANGDELMTHRDAAVLLRGQADQADLVHITRLVRDGKLTRYVDPDEPNPQRAGRVSRREVEALKGAS